MTLQPTRPPAASAQGRPSPRRAVLALPLLLGILCAPSARAQEPAAAAPSVASPPAASAPSPAAPPTEPAAAQPAADPLAAGKAVVRRYIEDVLAGGRLELIEDYVAPDYADRTPGADTDLAGPALVRRSQERLRSRFKDVRYTIDQLVAEGDLVVARYVVQAVHQARREGAPSPPPRQIAITGVTLFRVADGKIRESWTVNDQLEMFRQLGYEITPPKDEAARPAAAPGRPPAGPARP